MASEQVNSSHPDASENSNRPPEQNVPHTVNSAGLPVNVPPDWMTRREPIPPEVLAEAMDIDMGEIEEAIREIRETGGYRLEDFIDELDRITLGHE